MPLVPDGVVEHVASVDLVAARDGGDELLVSQDAPSRAILAAGAGGFERAYVTLTQGDFVTGDDAPEQVAARFDAISDRSGEIVPDMGAAQGMIELTKAQKAHGG